MNYVIKGAFNNNYGKAIGKLWGITSTEERRKILAKNENLEAKEQEDEQKEAG